MGTLIDARKIFERQQSKTTLDSLNKELKDKTAEFLIKAQKLRETLDKEGA